MRARIRRLHHSISLTGLQAITSLKYLAFGFQRCERDLHIANFEAPAAPQVRSRSRDRGTPSSRAPSRACRRLDRAARWPPRTPRRHARSRTPGPLACNSSNQRRHSGNGRPGDERQQRIVQFIRIARVRPDFGRDLLDRRRIQNAASPHRCATCCATARRARGAPRAERHRETRKDWR